MEAKRLGMEVSMPISVTDALSASAKGVMKSVSMPSITAANTPSMNDARRLLRSFSFRGPGIISIIGINSGIVECQTSRTGQTGLTCPTK